MYLEVSSRADPPSALALEIKEDDVCYTVIDKTPYPLTNVIKSLRSGKMRQGSRSQDNQAFPYFKVED
jgi:hypothetical protein